MIAWIIASVVIIPLALSEFSEISPWIAQHMLTWAARHIGNPRQAERYREEWLAGLQDVPGKVTKLIKAISIVFYTVPMMNWKYSRTAYLWPTRRLAFAFLALTMPRRRQLSLSNLIMSYGIQIGNGGFEGEAHTTVGELRELIELAPKSASRKWILPKSQFISGSGRLMIEMNHKGMFIVLHGIPVAPARGTRSS
jgi:hypothetical protein